MTHGTRNASLGFWTLLAVMLLAAQARAKNIAPRLMSSVSGVSLAAAGGEPGIQSKSVAKTYKWVFSCIFGDLALCRYLAVRLLRCVVTPDVVVHTLTAANAALCTRHVRNSCHLRMDACSLCAGSGTTPESFQTTPRCA
jgi:hypothetical protein